MEKEFTIAHWRKRSIKLLASEIEKCDTLCKNCHAEFHYLNRNFDISYQDYLNNYWLTYSLVQIQLSQPI